MYEPRHAPLATPAQFRARFRRAALVSLTMIATTLAVGMAGYRWIAGLAWIDAFHQAAMLLSGMGPVETMRGAASKLFNGVYALFCGVVLLAATATLFAPVIHRIMHRFHLEELEK